MISKFKINRSVKIVAARKDKGQANMERNLMKKWNERLNFFFCVSKIFLFDFKLRKLRRNPSQWWGVELAPLPGQKRANPPRSRVQVHLGTVVSTTTYSNVTPTPSQSTASHFLTRINFLSPIPFTSILIHCKNQRLKIHFLKRRFD